MTSQTDFVQPPRIAGWLVTLFASAEEAESIPGDLLEEFSHLASKSGVPYARNWYWRQTVKTIAHLAGAGFRAAPWSTAAAVAGGLLLSRFGSTLPEQAIQAILFKYRVYDNHFEVYKFGMSDGLLIAHFIAMMIIGGIVAVAAKGREMTATMTLGFIHSAMGVAGFLVARRYGFLPLAWVFAFSIATVVGGAIVRTRRSAPTVLNSPPLTR